jgi:hypothetical protein
MTRAAGRTQIVRTAGRKSPRLASKVRQIKPGLHNGSVWVYYLSVYFYNARLEVVECNGDRTNGAVRR